MSGPPEPPTWSSSRARDLARDLQRSPALSRARGMVDAGRPFLDSARTWNDPRRRAERKIRRARFRASLFGTASGSMGVATATVAATSAPDWLIVGGTGSTILLAAPAVAAVATYRRLRRSPLPPPAPRRRTLPPAGSAARESMHRLVAAERSLHELLGILGRSGAVAPRDVEDTAAIASAASASLDEVAQDIVAMERAAAGSRGAAAHLEASIAATALRLGEGVDQYDGLVAAAALLTSPGSSGSLTALDTGRDALQFASDRLEGWAFGIERLQRP